MIRCRWFWWDDWNWFLDTSTSFKTTLPHRLTCFVSTGHSGKHGHEFLEFEYSHGRLRYANNSNYRNDSLIRKESAWTCSLRFSTLPAHLPLSVDRSSGSQRTQAHCRIEWNHKVSSPNHLHLRRTNPVIQQRGWHELAQKEHRRKAGAGDSRGQRPYRVWNSQNWILGRYSGQRGSGGSEGLLLSRPRSQGMLTTFTTSSVL